MKKHTVYIIIVIFAILTTYLLYFYQPKFFQDMDNKLQDTKFTYRGKVSPSDSVVMVEIDGKSIDKYGRWPWNRKLIAKLIKKISNYGAKTIALDMVFSEPTDKESDKILAKAIASSKEVILGYFFRDKERKEEKEYALKRLPDFCIEDIELLEEVDKLPLKSFKSAETNIDPISFSGAGKGYFSVFPDKDGILRKLYLIAMFDDYIMPSLSIVAVSHFLKKKISLIFDKYGVVALKIGDEKLPVSTSGALLINFYGKSHTIKHISAYDILEGTLPKNFLKNKLVFLGVTEKAVGDLVPTPVDPNFPGTEVHCTVASNILQKFFLKRDFKVYLIDILTILLLPIIVCFISSVTKNTFFSLSGFVLFSGLYFLFNYHLFSNFNIRVTTIYPSFELILTFILAEAYRNIVLEFRSRYLKKAFSSYISKELVNQLINSPDKLKLGGEKKNITILFLDIRGFTSISEKLPPENLVKLLNLFFGPITELILKNKGMLDKYIGDAIMALFNVPIELKDHPEIAVKTSIDIIEKLKELNLQFKKENLPSIKVGIGINTGDVVVGNLGTKSRFDYTAVGDSVNLASRLESANKYLGTTILISEYTYKNLKNKDQFHIRYIGEVKVKGKEVPVGVYEVLTDNKIEKKDIEKFEKAVKLFKNGDLKESYKLFKGLYNKLKDPVSEYYIKKIKSKENLSCLHIGTEEEKGLL